MKFEKIGANSLLTRSLAHAPLKILNPQARSQFGTAYLTTYGGGLLSGDHICVEVKVSNGANAGIYTQGSTKIYRASMQQNATQEFKGVISTNSTLAMLSDPVVCYSSARYAQRQTFELSDYSNLIYLDAYTGGRAAYGEHWSFTSYSNTVRINHNGQQVFYESIALDRSAGSIDERFGPFRIVAALILYGNALKSYILKLEEEIQSRVLIGEDNIITASPIGDLGLLIRLAGRSTQHIYDSSRQLLAPLSGQFFEDPWLRKW